MFKTLLILLLIFVASWAIVNPGILISIPFPLSPPTVTLNLPLPINDVLVSNLELTNIQLRQADYQWRLSAPRAEVNVTRAVISFDWFYKHDSGKGIFIEEQLQLDFQWNFTTTSESRFRVDVTYTKIRPGKMKVELGGKVVETVAVEVTNLVLNKASVIFRGFISNKISSTLTDASKVLGQDLQLYHDVTHNKNIKVNTTLTSAPLISNQILYIQLNGAPYIQGESSGYLSPPQVLVKSNSSKIQLQVHKLMAIRVIQLILKIRGQVSLQIVGADITSVIDIDSLALSPVFPPMAFFPQNRDVVFSVSIPTVYFDFSAQNFLIKFRGQCIVSTQSKTDKSRTLYMSPINASASVQLSPIFGQKRSSIRLAKIQIIGFSADVRDVDNGSIVPEALTSNLPELMDWIRQAGNFQLNRKVLQPTYQNIAVVLNGRAISEHAYNIEIDLQ